MNVCMYVSVTRLINNDRSPIPHDRHVHRHHHDYTTAPMKTHYPLPLSLNVRKAYGPRYMYVPSTATGLLLT